MELLSGNPAPFAVMYSLGNILAISSSCFLYGPWTQIKQMFALTRIVTTSVYLSMLGLTLFLVFYFILLSVSLILGFLPWRYPCENTMVDNRNLLTIPCPWFVD